MASLKIETISTSTPAMTRAFPLAANDATLITKLQDICDHLDQELQHLNSLVERKSLQLRGIKSILEDAKGGGTPTTLLEIGVPSLETVLDAPVVKLQASVTNDDLSSAPVEVSIVPELQAVEESALEPEEPIPAETVRLTVSAPSLPKKSRGGKPSTAKKSASAQATKSKSPTTQLKSSKSKPSGQPTQLSQALFPQFQGKTLSEAVGEALAQASEPMNARAVASALYKGLSIDDLNRATKTTATILAGGRAKGKWQSPAKGLYQSGMAGERSNLVSEALSGAT